MMVGGRSFTLANRSWFGRQVLAVVFTMAVVLIPTASLADGASLKISPIAGVYEVGGLVDVSFVVDTGGQAINAVQADILFPADKLQVVNPVASTSFISLWVTAPTYSNTDGTLHFQGGLPTPGIKTSGGVVSTVTFRIKAAGKAAIRYAPTSRVLLNDGAGTNILTSSGSAEFTLKIPPPAGPIVTSPTHPDSNAWFNNPQVQWQWEAIEGANGYSYIFDQSSKTVPDETVDTTATAVGVKATSDGVWYFHVRAKTDTWGGVTTVPVQIDATPPAAFSPKFDASTMTIEDTPTLRFVTTDAASGIDHYEVKQVMTDAASAQVTSLFIETGSPYSIGKLPAGTYEYIVRAFDRAGNNVDASAKLSVVAAGLPFYANVPFLRDPAVANIALLSLAALTLGLLITLLLRRFRIRATFRHDLSALEHDAMKKTQALEKELDELRRAQQLVNENIGSVAQSPWATPPATAPIPQPAPPIAPPVSQPPIPLSPTPPASPLTGQPASPYRYQAPPSLPLP